MNNKIYKEFYLVGSMKRRGIIAGKRGAFELSITTMIVIVLSITMLIMGLVLIRNIFTGATDSVDSLSSSVQEEINKIFTDENKKIVIYVGEDKTAKIKAGTNNFGVVIAARTNAGSEVTSKEDLQYKLELDSDTEGNCVDAIGIEQTKAFFNTKLDTWNNMPQFSGTDSAGDIITLDVPEGTILCAQKVFVTIRDRTIDLDGDTVGGDFFIVEIIRSGLF